MAGRDCRGAVAVLAGFGVTASAALGLFGSLSNYFTDRPAIGCYPQPKLATSLSLHADRVPADDRVNSSQPIGTTVRVLSFCTGESVPAAHRSAASGRGQPMCLVEKQNPGRVI